MKWQEELKKIVYKLSPEGNISKQATSVLPELIPYIKYSDAKTFIASLLEQQRDDDFKKIINGLAIFTEKPIGDIESDLCDWNKPGIFASNYTPQELQDKVIERIKKVKMILNTPELK